MPQSRWRPWLIGALLAAIYYGRGSVPTVPDAEATMMLPYAIVRGDGPFLDRYRPILQAPGGPLPESMMAWRGHVVSLYPVGPSLAAVPLVAPQLWLRDRIWPGWDARVESAYAGSLTSTRIAAALIAAAVGGVLEVLLRRAGLGRGALPAVLAASLGSGLWTIAGQALWQHGPAALALALMMLWLQPARPGRLRLLAAGCAAGMMLACRLIDAVFALAALAWLARARPRELPWFLPGLVLIGGLVLAWNLTVFGTPEGGQGRLEALHPALHGVAGPWSGSLAGGAAGTFLSPARGLFVYCPWALLALVALPWSVGKIDAGPARWLIASLVVYALILSKYAVWWAGHSYGPRYWTDAAPILAVAFAAAWTRAAGRRALLVPLGLAVVWSVFLQAVGAILGPGDWNLTPRNVDLHHERLWDWRDNEPARLLRGAFRGGGPAGKIPGI